MKFSVPLSVILVGIALGCSLANPSYLAAKEPRVTYQLQPGKTYSYHLQHRTKAYRMLKRGLSVRDRTTDADVALSVIAASDTGSDLDVRVFNQVEDDIKRGYWTFSNLTLIPHSQIEITPRGRVRRGSILTNDTLRSETSKLRDRVAYKQLGTLSDRTELRATLVHVLPQLPRIDSFVNGYSWTDTLIAPKQVEKLEAKTEVYGDNNPVLQPILREIEANSVRTCTLKLDAKLDGKPCWCLVETRKTEGIRQKEELSEESTAEYYFAIGSNVFLGSKVNRVRKQGPERWEITENVSFTGEK